MSKAEIYIVVEGYTEQTFVREVLAPQMSHKQIYIHPVLIGNPGHKGGNIRFERATDDIGKFLKQRNNIYVSTMFDYFRIEPEWPGRDEVARQSKNGRVFTAIEKAQVLEAATMDEVVRLLAAYNAERRFIPYIEMHEFEALLFSDPHILAEKIEVNVSQIRKILKEYKSPEDINDDPTKAPSKRLSTLTNEYRKVAYGKAISEAIGIQTIRRECAHFDDWLTRIERLPGCLTEKHGSKDFK